MRTRSRRRIDMFLLGAGALAAGGVAAIGGVIGDGERVSGMWVGAELHGDGTATIAEIIDYDFGLAVEKHGIFRTIPGLSTDDPVHVSSNSAPDAIAARTSEMVSGERGVKLKIGDANTTISGRHRYRIEYEHDGIVTTGGRLAWDAVGTGWTVDVRQAEVHVVAPWAFTDVECHKGRTGSVGGCDVEEVEPGHLVVETGTLKEGEGLTIDARRGTALDGGAPFLPAPPVSAPPDPGAGLALPAAVAAVAGAGASATASKLVRRGGRERVGTGGVSDAAWAGGGEPRSEVRLDHTELAGMATTEFAPPEGITAPMGGIILSEGVQPHHRVAWLIEAAIEGAVELQEEGEGRKQKVTLRRTSGGKPSTRQPIDKMFAGRSEIALGKYDPKFAAGWAAVGKQLEAWEASSDLWDKRADQRKTVVRLLGGAAAIGGGLLVALGGAFANRWGAGWLALVALGAIVAGGGLAASVRGWELRVRTPKGSGTWLRVESFRRFLAQSEGYHAEEAAKRGVLREYTAWAVAVGEIDRWERAVGAAGAIPESAGLGYVHMAPVLAASTQSSATAPSSSSSSGGGGGGSVGGGGGGGGGGSW